MSDLIWNIRIGGWFFQWRGGRSLDGRKITLERVPNRPGPGEAWLAIYQAPWQ